MSEIDKHFDSFDFLRSILSHFPTESANIPLKAYWVMSSVFVERSPTFLFQNDSKSTKIAQKRRCRNF